MSGRTRRVSRRDEDGIALRGLMIRHLVMPHRVAGTRGFVNWVAEKLPKSTYVNIMSQYRPMYKADKYPDINRRITASEYYSVVEHTKSLGLKNLDIQG